jgi:hypothetical protein
MSISPLVQSCTVSYGVSHPVLFSLVQGTQRNEGLPLQFPKLFSTRELTPPAPSCAFSSSRDRCKSAAASAHRPPCSFNVPRLLQLEES